MKPPDDHHPFAHHTRGVALMLLSTAFFTANVLLIRALGQLQHVNVWLITCVRFGVGLTLAGTTVTALRR